MSTVDNIIQYLKEIVKLKKLILQRDATGKMFLQVTQEGFKNGKDTETLKMLKEQIQRAPLAVEDSIGYEAFEILKKL